MGVSEILAGGWQLVRGRPKLLAIWGAVYLVLAGVSFALIWPMMPALIEFQTAAALAQATRQPPPAPPAGFFGAIFGLNAIMLLAMTAIFAAVVRAVARGGDDAFGFLRVGMDELRLVGLVLLLAVIGTVAMLLFLLLAGILVAGLVAAVGPGAFVVAAVLYLVMIGLLVWAQVRISLAGALTVLRGRIVVREAWRMTAGRFWTLFGAYLVLGIAYMVVAIAMLAILNPGLLSMSMGAADPTTVESAIVQQQAMMSGARMIVIALVGSVINAVGLAWGLGSIATAAIGFDRQDHATGVFD